MKMYEREMEFQKKNGWNFVTIVTPNKWHFEPAMMALERYSRVLDKPITFSLEEAVKLREKVEENRSGTVRSHTSTRISRCQRSEARLPT
jgi:predicted dehydrogenase